MQPMIGAQSLANGVSGTQLRVELEQFVTTVPSVRQSNPTYLGATIVMCL
jgi:hypothetical protein